MIIIGLGTGRSGTTSLAGLLGLQPETIIFHEMNPSSMRFSDTPAPVLNTIKEFGAIMDGGNPSFLTADLGRAPTVASYDKLCAMPKVSHIGDIAFYYLTYVEDIIATSDKVRFVCLKRDRAATIKSWQKKAAIRRWTSKWLADRFSSFIQRIPFYKSKNFWMDHDGSRWLPDAVWDKCFPSFEADSMEEAIGKYYDYYYAEAEKYQEKFPDVFQMFSLEELNTEDGKHAIMDFCGFDTKNRNMEDVWVHRIKE